jgi:glutamate racemase
VEKGITSGPEAEETVSRSLMPLLAEGADTIVLGCTHYPFLTDTILKTAGRPVTVIDPAPAVARHLVEVMEEEGLIKSDCKGFSIELHSSGDDTCLKNTYNNLI